MNLRCLLIPTVVLWVVSAARAELDAAAFEAYEVARNWLIRGQTPEQLIAVPARGVAAVHVTLRMEGWTVGQATGLGADPLPTTGSEPAEAIDLMPLVAAALTEALTEARASLASRGVPVADGAELALDLQVARPLERLRLEALAELPRRITPHAHGLALRRDGRWAWVFPGNAVAANTDLNGQLNRLMAELDIPLDQKLSIGTADGPALYRFEVVHITTPIGGTRPVRLYRGHEPLPTEPVDEQMLALLAEQWADHLVKRQRDDGRFAGTYEPTADRYRPETADATATAYAVFALSRAAKLDGVDQTRRAEAALLGAQALARLIGKRDIVGRQVVGQDAEATALSLLAMLECPGAARFKGERDRLIASLAGMLNGDGRCRTDLRPEAPPVSRETQGLVAAALAAAFDQTRDSILLDRATAALGEAWGGTDEAVEHGALPWLAIAETTLMRLGRVTGNRERLSALCERMWAVQVKPWGDDASTHSPDTAGGFILGTRLFDEPTAESALVLAGLAVCMRLEEIAPASERSRWLIGGGLAARFLDQLTMHRSGAYYTRNPAEAIGGVRLALWDNRQPLHATAAALLAATELRQTLQALGDTVPQR